MTPRRHRLFVQTAKRISPPLHEALVRIGRLEIPRRQRGGLPRFLARVIVGQQLSTAAARSIWARIETAVKARAGTVPTFFCARNARTLRACGLSRAKVRALTEIRKADEAGLLAPARLARMTHSQRVEHLRGIWGIGQWTADMTSMFYFGDHDVWPEGDAGAYRALTLIVGRRSRGGLLKIADAFAPQRSFLALSMWRFLDARGARAATTKQPV
jgi:DNA-3-methyladenine glycosylase II